MSTKPIPKDVAIRLCEEIQQEHRGKWYTLAAWFCPVCAKLSSDEGLPGCLASDDGCWMVNRRYARQVGRS